MSLKSIKPALALAMALALTTMSAWAVSAASATDHLRHPWFSHPSLKRKHSDSSDDDTNSDQETGAPSFYPTPPPESAGYIGTDGEFVERKRRRCDTIERRMARMYIDARNADPNQASPGYPHNKPSPSWNAPSLSATLSTASDASYAYTAGSTSPVAQSSLLPQYAVEEPVSPEFRGDVQLEPTPPSSSEYVYESTITEVRMKGAEPAWYEREKDSEWTSRDENSLFSEVITGIVITDLDEAVQEAEEEEEEYKSEAEPHPDASEHSDSNADYSISTVLLDHIKRQANFPYMPRTDGEENGGALVLFRPPPLPLFSSSSPSTQKRDVNSDEVQVEEIDESEARAFRSSGDFTVGAVSMEQEDEMIGEPMDMDVDIEM